MSWLKAASQANGEYVLRDIAREFLCCSGLLKKFEFASRNNPIIVRADLQSEVLWVSKLRLEITSGKVRVTRNNTGVQDR